MKTLSRTSAILALSLLLSSYAFGQTSASASVSVNATIYKGLSMSLFGGALDFGEIVALTSAQTPSISEQNGAIFKVVGHPTKNVKVSFSAFDLTNTEDNTKTIGFTPVVDQTGSSSTYVDASDYTSGATIALPAVGSDGILYMWVGGSLAIAADQTQGSYTGTLTMNVEY